MSLEKTTMKENKSMARNKSHFNYCKIQSKITVGMENKLDKFFYRNMEGSSYKNVKY